MKAKKVSMTVQIMIAMVLGVLVGAIGKDKVEGIKLLGDIFLRLIQMSIILLVMGQIIEAVGSLNPKELGRQGIKIIVIFLVTSFLALSIVVVGISAAIFQGIRAALKIPEFSRARKNSYLFSSL